MSRFARQLARSKWAQTASGLLLWAGGTFSGHALAQTPVPVAVAASRSGVPPYHLNKHTIKLPIQLDDKYRPMLQEIQLWIKETPSAAWTLREKAPATQTEFTFQAPRDGEYWFTMVTVDRKGKCVPADVSKEEPAMAVIVDTQAPQLDVMLLGSVLEGQLIQCDVRDAHPDAAKTRVQYQTADKIFRDLEPLAERPNVWCIPAQANITGQLRFCASDIAGNLATRECTVAQLPVPVQTAPSTQPGLPPGAPELAGPSLQAGRWSAIRAGRRTEVNHAACGEDRRTGDVARPSWFGLWACEQLRQHGSAESAAPGNCVEQASPARAADHANRRGGRASAGTQIIPGAVQTAPAVKPATPTTAKRRSCTRRSCWSTAIGCFSNTRSKRLVPAVSAASKSGVRATREEAGRKSARSRGARAWPRCNCLATACMG